ncbi:MAG: hypothetical protein SPL89_00615 [Clostridia bacterium]|nr:hypothetical protein [Clostridia bacterium]
MAEFLVSESERTGSNTLRITHEQIAQNISSAREAASPLRPAADVRSKFAFLKPCSFLKSNKNSVVVIKTTTL